jgi:hypothetical protein
MRVDPAVGNLRRRKLYKAMRDATITAALRERFRIVHISLQRNHIHLLAEAADKQALARGMQGCRVAWPLPTKALTRSGQGDFHHPALLSGRLT